MNIKLFNSGVIVEGTEKNENTAPYTIDPDRFNTRFCTAQKISFLEIILLLIELKAIILGVDQGLIIGVKWE